MSNPLQVTVQVEDASPQELVSLARELDSWITRTVPEVRTSVPAPGQPRPGEKGAEIQIGTLLLTFLTSGAAVALVNSLTTYIKERRRSVKLEVKDAAGRAVSLSADNIGGEEVDGLMRRLTELARGPEPAAT
jgi:hypothetical protein